MATKHGFKEVLNSVGDKYTRCWEILSTLKTGSPGDLQAFQPMLCDCMIQLSKEYRRIQQERQRLIDRKHCLNQQWFVARQRSLAAKQDAIRLARGIGQQLGDSFAWLFYQNESTLLEEHAKHELSDQLHDGIGGVGEREFLAGVPFVDGAMVLHHSTTTLLRIGDVSLIDLDTFLVKGIGELKTSRDGPNRLKVLLYAIGDEVKIPSTPKQKPICSVDTMRASERDRFERQIKRMSAVLRKRDETTPEAKLEIEEGKVDQEFGELLRAAGMDRWSCRRVGDGLLCLVYRRRPRSFVDSVHNTDIADAATTQDGFASEVQKILIPESQHNSLGIGTFMYSREGRPIHVLGTMPLFWSTLDLELIRRLIFQELLVITVFNPAHLITKLHDKGFEVSTTGKGDLEVSTQMGEIELHVANMTYFIHLIIYGLFSEDHVVNLVEQSVRFAMDRANRHGPNGRINLRFHNILWRPKSLRSKSKDATEIDK